MDAVEDGRPSPPAAAGADTVRPAGPAQAREAVLDAAGGRRPLLFRGGGTKLDWGAPPERVGLVVDTCGLDRLVSHNAGDLTATVQAGMPLARLQSLLADAGQWLAIDPPPAAPATVGGVLAANDSGPRRLRYGSMRDLVIGVTVVLSDGAVARAGGQVIKNVAGYDLGKLLCGSLGSLGLVTEVTVRLQPLAAASRTVRVPADASQAARLTLDLLSSPVEPSAVEWTRGSLWVWLEGSDRGVGPQAQATVELAARHGLEAAQPDDDPEQLWAGLAAAHGPREGATVARASTLPSQLGGVDAALRESAEAAGVHADLASHAALGLHTARLSGGDAAAHAAAVRGWRRRLAGLGGTVVLRSRPEGVDRLVDPWLEPDGPRPTSLGVMRRLKTQLDPWRRCAPGRLPGGI